MFTGKVAVSAGTFNNGKADKNGLQPVMLRIIGGKGPNRNVLAGTIADSERFEIGNCYLAQCTEVEPDPQYGRRFIWTNLGRMTALELLQVEKMIGTPEVFDVAKEAINKDLENIEKAEGKIK